MLLNHLTGGEAGPFRDPHGLDHADLSEALISGYDAYSAKTHPAPNGDRRQSRPDH